MGPFGTAIPKRSRLRPARTVAVLGAAALALLAAAAAPPAMAQPLTPPAGPRHAAGPPRCPSPPRELPYRRSEAIPEGYHHSSKARRGLLIAGATSLTSIYLSTAAVAVIDQESRSRDDLAALYVPLAGPFIALDSARPNTAGLYALVGVGISQAAAAAILVAALVARKDVLVRNDLASVRWTLAPAAVGGAGAGLGVLARW